MIRRIVAWLAGASGARRPYEAYGYDMRRGDVVRLIGRYETPWEACIACGEWLAENSGGHTSWEYAEKVYERGAVWDDHYGAAVRKEE